MIKIRLYNPIANANNAWWYSWDGEDGVFSLKFVKRIFSENPEENDFQFNIHCPGGEVEEGLAIYDFLRTSGKNIHMNIEGGCHSMAVTLLLAAPKENRSANPNAVALIHEVQGGSFGSTSDIQAAAHTMQMLQDRILDIYTDRTGIERETLEVIMKEQREHSAKDLLQLGFISKINSYNTNLNFKSNMGKEGKSLLNMANQMLNKISSFVGNKFVNYDFVDDEGNVLFSTEGDDDSLEVGMTASPDGTFTIADGRTVTIADGAITEIQEAAEEEETEEATEEENTAENASEELANLRAENVALREALEESGRLIQNLKKEVKSNYVPKGRTSNAKTNGAVTPSREERKAELRDAMKFTKK